MSATLLRLEGVGKGYQRGEGWRAILDDVSLRVDRGEIVAVCGDRLQGKTTLLEVAAGLKAPDDGVVRIDGVEIAALSGKARQALLAGVIGWGDRRGPQHPWRVLDYVALPLSTRGLAAARRRALKALEHVGAAHCGPQQWQQLADWERILVSFARLYAQRPQLIVIDDLFEGLHVRSTQQAGDLLRALVEELGCGALISVSHTDAAMVADRVLVLERGSVTVRSDLSLGAEHTAAVIELPRRVGQPGGG